MQFDPAGDVTPSLDGQSAKGRRVHSGHKHMHGAVQLHANNAALFHSSNSGSVRFAHCIILVKIHSMHSRHLQ